MDLDFVLWIHSCRRRSALFATYVPYIPTDREYGRFRRRNSHYLLVIYCNGFPSAHHENHISLLCHHKNCLLNELQTDKWILTLTITHTHTHKQYFLSLKMLFGIFLTTIGIWIKNEYNLICIESSWVQFVQFSSKFWWFMCLFCLRVCDLSVSVLCLMLFIWLNIGWIHSTINFNVFVRARVMK